MKVFKFGGASVEDAESIRNVVKILEHHSNDTLFVVLSAMGKNTNALEKIAQGCFAGEDVEEQLEIFKNHQRAIVKELNLGDFHASVSTVIEVLFKELDNVIRSSGSYADFDELYDRIVVFGELLSTGIMQEYLHYHGKNSIMISACDWVKTDDYFRFAKVNTEVSSEKLKNLVNQNKHAKIFLTQGFIGSAIDGRPTTLGREGSDYTAALAGAILAAESVTVWKDVPGLLNADPKRMGDLQKIDKLSYREAVELAYYGAKIIHPKTIKPIENNAIPLYIKSFLQPDAEGTVIHLAPEDDVQIPSYIFHENQILISISVKDMSFITEESLHHIFGILSRYRIHVRLMQISAVSFSICIDFDKIHCSHLLNQLAEDYTVRYNDNLELITIRHYQNADIDALLKGKKILLEQRSRTTAQFVVRNESILLKTTKRHFF